MGARAPAETVEVVVDEVVKLGIGEVRKLLKAAGSMDELRSLLELYAHQRLPAVLVLREAYGERVLPVRVPLDAALDIWQAVSGRRMSRLLAHDFTQRLLEAVGLEVRSVAMRLRWRLVWKCRSMSQVRSRRGRL
ncbi:hypothetical protein E0L93_02505 [Rubrobacter taiwanensis]|uniref:Uncharacterized protein n=1 Tax=Rubrobacter taiwanensis TaxID=185139 RepID=A0A4R1BRB4_9ACTN|nr:DUF151 domain-containing protein [Rubrobacter taiwanensis]TCJ19847.1 hypothetical protein E0L93_02505 [Rubrobacter taiwanensis]